MVENLFENENIGSISKLEGGILSQNGETEDVLTIQVQIGEIYPQSPGKLSIISFNPIFQLVSL